MNAAPAAVRGGLVALCLLSALLPARSEESDMLVFSARHWDGEYWSRDIPGGVEIVPTTSSIYVVPADGSAKPRQIVDVNGSADNPQCSPDGQWVYFQARTEGTWDVYRCRIDGAGIENLTASHQPRGSTFGFRLSRDGSKVVYTFSDGAIGRVGLMNADGSEAHLIAPDIGYHYMADISPDNQSVVFAHTAKGYTLALKHLGAEGIVSLTPELPESFCPQFTPDGKTLVFFRRDGDVYRIGVDGKGLQRLTTGNQYVEFRLSPADKHGSSDPPAVSPDGSRIAYCAVRDGVAQVFTMNLDGSDQTQITFRKTPCGRVRWSPDGKRVAFVAWEGAYPQLLVVASGGGSPVQLTDIPAAAYFPTWWAGGGGR
jgi:Tol biopolymer transport system component